MLGGALLAAEGPEVREPGRTDLVRGLYLRGLGSRDSSSVQGQEAWERWQGRERGAGVWSEGKA